ncbi:MFS transporter [Neobacillus niacini]|uniref:MFS transporter n=1 Tax=Neobacillus niacini TaxID=86668 RepID=UPI003983633A
MAKTRLLFYMSAVFILLPVFGARPLTSLFAENLQASIIEIGIISSCYSLAPLILAIFAGRYIDRFGEKIPLIVGALGILISLLLPYIFPVIPVLYVSQLILGGSQLLAILSIQNGVSKSSTNETRDKAIGNFSVFTSIGILLGPLLGGYATEHIGFELSYLMLGLVPILAVCCGVMLKTVPRSAALESEKSSKVWKETFVNRNLSSSIFVSMIILSAVDLFYVYFPLYAQSQGIRPSQIGMILAVQALMNSLVRIFMPKLIILIGRVKTLYIFMSMGAIAFALIPFFSSPYTLAISAFLLGTGLGVTQPITIILTYNASPPGRTGEILGIRLASNRLAQTIIPFLFASLSTFIGLGAIFLINSFVIFFGAWMAHGIKDKEYVEQPVTLNR